MENSKAKLQKDVKQALPKKDPEENPVITIDGIIPGTTDLVLSDDGYTVAEKNTEVTWLINTPLVLEITDIRIKDDSENVFKDNDQPKKISKEKWSGITKDRVHPRDGNRYVRTEYSIHYIDYSGNAAEYDPIIQVNA